jgi:putative membrane protein
LAYFPIAYGLSKLLGVCGIVLALSIVNLPGAIANRVQYSRIMNGTAKGIWRK